MKPLIKSALDYQITHGISALLCRPGRRLTFLFILLSLQYGCVTRVESTQTLDTDHSQIPEAQLLDITVRIFEPLNKKIYEYGGVSITEQFEGFRIAEANYLTVATSLALQNTQAFGSVRTSPHTLANTELFITGEVLLSNGRTLKLQIDVFDSNNNQLLSETYKQNLKKGDFSDNKRQNPALYSALFNQIANDIVHLNQRLNPEEINKIQRIAEMRFAREFSPDAFSEYLTLQPDGLYKVKRLPPKNDPVFQYMDDISIRHDMYTDLVQERMEFFYLSFREAYFDLSRYIMVVQTELRENPNAMRFFTLIPGSETWGEPIKLKGLAKLRYIYQKVKETTYNSQISLSAVIAPTTIELDKKTFELQGSVTEQYEEWKAILKELYLESEE